MTCMLQITNTCILWSDTGTSADPAELSDCCFYRCSLSFVVFRYFFIFLVSAAPYSARGRWRHLSPRNGDKPHNSTHVTFSHILTIHVHSRTLYLTSTHVNSRLKNSHHLSHIFISHITSSSSHFTLDYLSHHLKGC